MYVYDVYFGQNCIRKIHFKKTVKSTIYKMQLKQLCGTSKRINKWVIKINK